MGQRSIGVTSEGCFCRTLRPFFGDDQPHNLSTPVSCRAPELYSTHSSPRPQHDSPLLHIGALDAQSYSDMLGEQQ